MDHLTPEERSRNMARVRGKGNRTTELRVASRLAREGVRGWTKHCADLPGRPDFVFRSERLALFVDGCFWHGCPRCGHLPKSRLDYWKPKIERNIRRDRRVRRTLNRQGYRVMRVWEHEVSADKWFERLEKRLSRRG